MILQRMMFFMQQAPDDGGKGPTGTPPKDEKSTLLTGDDEKAKAAADDKAKAEADAKAKTEADAKAKAEADAKAKAEADKPIEVKFPDEFKLDDARYKKFAGIAKEAGLKSEGAQKIADFYVEMQREEQTAQVEVITKWAEDAKADKDIGGANFDQNLLLAKKVLDRVGTPALKEVLGSTGLGNHVEVIRALAKIGKVISEDRLPGADAGDGKGESVDDAMKAAFPNSAGMFPTK